MRIIYLSSLLLFILSAATAFGSSDLDSRIAEFKLLQTRVKKECLDNPKSKDYKIEVDGQKLNCDELILITNQLRLEIEKEVTELRACAENTDSPHQDLAVSTESIIEKTPPSCEPSPDQKQCLTDFSCTMLAVTPMPMIIKLSGKVLNSEALNSCGDKGNNCLTSVLRGIFDSLWSSLNLIWDLGKLAVTKTGELLVGLVKKSEAATSDKAMAAQQASPGFLKSLKADPIGTIKAMAKNLYESLEESAMNHYGCEKWAGAPLISKCLSPMTTWNCGSCGQKAQVFCGIAGYAVGEIGTALLTGGLLAGGKTILVGSMKIAAGPAKNVMSFMGKTFPKVSAKVSAAGSKIGALAKTTLTAVEAKSITLWEKIANSSTTKLISKTASSIAASSVGKAVGIGLKPVAWYLRAMDDAFRLGFSSVENVAAKLSKTGQVVNTAIVSKQVFHASGLADEAMGVSKPSLVPVSNQSKASEGLIIVESKSAPVVSKPVEVIAPVESKSASSAVEISSSKPVTKSGASSKAQSAGLYDDTTDMSQQISKFKNDQDYFQLFASPKLYDDYHNDLAAVITTLERTQPNLSKIEIKKSIERMMNSCDL